MNLGKQLLLCGYLQTFQYIWCSKYRALCCEVDDDTCDGDTCYAHGIIEQQRHRMPEWAPRSTLVVLPVLERAGL